MAPLGFAPLLFLSSSRFRVYIFVLLTASAFVVAVSTFLSVSGYQEESLELFSALGRVFLVAAVLLVAEVFWLVKHSENVPPELLKHSENVPPELLRLPENVPGGLLILAVSMSALGEGAAFGGALLLLISLLVIRPPIPIKGLLSTQSLMLLGVFVYIASGLLAHLWSGHFFLRASNLGVFGPFLVMPIIAYGTSLMGGLWAKRALMAFVAILAASSLFALAQFAFNLNESGGLMSLVELISAKHQMNVPGTTDRSVAGGFYFHRLKLAHVLLLGIGILSARQLFAQLSLKLRAAEVSILLLFFVALVATYSRGALLGLGAGGLMLLVFAGRRWQLAGGAVALLAVVLMLMTPSVRDRLSSSASVGGNSDRAMIWSTAARTIYDNPFGVGLGNYPKLLEEKYTELKGGERLPRTYAHNIFLTAWAESGALGVLFYLLAFVALISSAISRLRQRSKESEDDDFGWLAAAVLFAATSFLVVGLTHDILYHKVVSLAFSALVGVFWGISHRSTQYNPTP